jgi:photosystem II stability/assembly factor-like uncharacterized protein
MRTFTPKFCVLADPKAVRAITAAALLLVFAAVTSAQIGWRGSRVGPAKKDLNAVYFADSKRGWIGGDDGFVSATNDGGQSWMQQSVSTSKPVSDIFFSGDENGFLLAGDEIFGTTDGGGTWRSLRRFAASEFDGGEVELYSVRFTGKKKGWVVGSVSRKDRIVDSIVFFTNDAGVTWERRRVPTREELIHLDFVDDKRGWIVGAEGTILRTKNSGGSWESQTSGVKATLYHVDFRNDKDGWAVGERGVLLRTSNGGDSWMPVESNIRSNLLSVKFANEDDGWIAGRGGIILRSEDAGRSWIRQATPTQQNIYALFIGKKTGWAVGGDGIVLQYER